MVSSVEKLESRQSLQDASIILPRPKSVAVRMGRTFVLIVETSKKTLKIFAESMEQIRLFIEKIPSQLLTTSKSLFVVRTQKKPVNPLLPPAPKWEFRVQVPRRCKSREIKPLRSLTERQIKQVKAGNLSKLPSAIPNGSNGCFMAAILISLSVSPKFRSRIDSKELNNRPVVENLRRIYSIIDNKKASAKRDLTAREIDEFRRTCIEAGFTSRSNSSQEDASDFSQFLLRELGCEDIAIQQVNEHNFSIKVDLTRALQENQLVLQVGDSAESDLQNLVLRRKSSVELMKNNAMQYLVDEDDLSEENLETISNMQEVETIPVEQTLQFSTTNLPPILPIFLERGNYDPVAKKFTINRNKFIPNLHLDIPLADCKGVARYELVSAVTREQHGEMLNKDSGHYTSFIRSEHKGQPIFVKYDSTSRTVQGAQALDEIAENGRIYNYEFRQILKT